MPMRCSRRASSILANSPCARRKSTCAAAASRSACERMARRGAVERAGARSRGHAGFFLGQGARGRVDEPRSAAKHGGERGSRLLVALAQETLAKGRAIRPRAKAARSAHRLRRRCAAAQGGAGGRHCLPHRPRELLLQETGEREVGGDRSGAEGSVAHLQELRRTYILNSHDPGQLVILTYRYRLLPLKSQDRVLERLCEAQRELYNAALEERIDCYRKTGKTRTYIDQCKALTQCRRDLPEVGELPVTLQRWTLKRLDDAFQGFFHRLKARSGKVGLPRFRGKGRWEAFGFAEFCGIRFDGRRLRFAGMPGGLKLHLHRPMPGDPDIRSCVFRRDGRGWHVCLQIAVGVPEKRAVSTALGVDLGLKVFAYCSDNVVIAKDRKSTRLNSSHTVTSYAVFCLKK